MALVIPPGYAHISMRFALDNYPRQAVTTWGIKLSGTTLDPDDLAWEQYSAFVNAWASFYDNNVTFAGCRTVVGQDGVEPTIGFHEGDTKGAGGNRETVPPAIAVLVDKRTGQGGRRNRGRMFLPWAATESWVSEAGVINTPGMQVLRDAASSFYDNIQGDGGFDYGSEGMYVLHGPFHGAPTPVTSLSVSNVVSTQRRRQTR